MRPLFRENVVQSLQCIVQKSAPIKVVYSDSRDGGIFTLIFIANFPESGSVISPCQFLGEDTDDESRFSLFDSWYTVFLKSQSKLKKH